MTAPAQPVPQNMEALALANEISDKRARDHRRIAAMSAYEAAEEVAKLLHDPPEHMRTIPLIVPLCWVHRIGRAAAARIIRRASGPVPISTHQQLGVLSQARRVAVAGALLDATASYAVERHRSLPGAHEIVDRDRDVCVGITASPQLALTHAQRLSRLRAANERRVAAADFKRRLKWLSRRDALKAMIEQLDDPDERQIGSLKVRAALEALPGIGRSKADRMLLVANVRSPDTRVTGLSVRQRRMLGHLLADRLLGGQR